MIGEVGPYTNEEGDIWVPRIVSYLKARAIAADAIGDPWLKLVYVGKSDATLYGFTNDCSCDSGCVLEDGEADLEGPSREGECIVPAWHFRQEER